MLVSQARGDERGCNLVSHTLRHILSLIHLTVGVSGAWGSPAACNAGAILNTNYLRAVKSMCPAAYGYAYDDKVATIACTTTTRYHTP